MSRWPGAASDVPIVLFRTSDGSAVALEDRDAHKPYPLSLGRVDGDTIVSGYSGFVYDARGRCVQVPTQDEIPVGARVRAYPVHDDGVFVWCWLGDPARSACGLRRRSAGCSDPDWTTVGDGWETGANAGCCWRTSPTSPTSRWSIRSSLPRC